MEVSLVVYLSSLSSSIITSTKLWKLVCMRFTLALSQAYCNYPSNQLM